VFLKFEEDIEVVREHLLDIANKAKRATLP
jgi:hypothetical protein